jgi:uncharacterized protein (TIGR02246 family)
MMNRLLCSAVLTFAFAVAMPAPGGTEMRRPVLVSVDDLPIAMRLHAQPAERKAITQGLLAALAKHRIQAVALVTWSNVLDPTDLELLRMWIDAGHELGNHSWDHLSYTHTDKDPYVADVEKARARLAEFLAPLGRKPRFFRFPFLREGNTKEKLDAMRAYLEKSGQRNLPVTIDNDDWAYAEPWVKARQAGDAKAMARVAQEYHENLHTTFHTQEARSERLFGRAVPEILLLHANEIGSTQWDALFTWLEETGHRFASADSVLADAAYAEAHSYVNDWGPSLWDRVGNERRTARAQADVKELLQTQADAWNRGDLDAFCAVYAEDAVFASPSGLTTGRAAVRERYRTRYPTPAAMGTLSFEFEDFRVSYSSAAPSDIRSVSVVARWKLAYPDKPEASGLTLLVLLQRGSGWTIVQDASM